MIQPITHRRTCSRCRRRLRCFLTINTQTLKTAWFCWDRCGVHVPFSAVVRMVLIDPP